jgi:hypothetical protein
MRKCPNCGADKPLALTLYKCKECNTVYCGDCNDKKHGGGCPSCGSHEYEAK